MAVMNYDDIAQHAGHDIEVAIYAGNKNAAIECVTCYEVLIDFDNEKEEPREDS